MARTQRPSAQHPAGQEFVITRVFDAPRPLVWQAYTEREHLLRWWGPAGCTMLAATLDLRPGGVFHYGMRTPDGHEMWGKLLYREIVAPERLVFIVSFSDAQGGLTRHPLSASWPLAVLNTMTFAEQAGRTTLTLRGLPHEATEAERQTFAAGFDSMRMGFGGMLDQLARYLVQMPQERAPQCAARRMPAARVSQVRVLARSSARLPGLACPRGG